MKFPFHRDSQDEKTLYAQRIAELEAELDAAQQVITGQQQILEANLEASIREEDPEVVTLDLPPDPALPPLRPLADVASIERPPIPLPDFGPPLNDIAQCVFRAADSGNTASPVVEPMPLEERHHPVEDNITEEAIPAVPMPLYGNEDRLRSLKISGALLMGALALFMLWSFAARVASYRKEAGKTAVAVAAREAVSPPALLSLPAPVVEKPEPRRPKEALAQKEPPKRSIALHKSPVLLSAAPTLSDMEEKPAALHKKEVLRFHSRRARQIVRRPADTNVTDGNDEFAREERRHPPPGWDEEADRWLDRVP